MDEVVPELLDARRMRQMLEHLPYFAVVIDRERHLLWVNRLDSTLTPSQVIGVKVDNFVHADAVATLQATIERAYTTGEVTRYEARGYAEGAIETWYGTTVVPLPPNAAGEERALLLSNDVTKQHAAERALRESERRFRLLTESSPDFIVLVDGDLRITYLNREPGPEIGPRREQLIGRSIADATHPDSREVAISTIRRTLETGEPGSYPTGGAFEDVGSHYACRVIRLSSDEDQPLALITVTNVTEQHKLEAQLQQAQRLESIGQLAGGVAHDFNNILFIIQSSLGFLRSALAEGEDPEPEIDAIAIAVERATEMTRSLLTIGRRQPRKPKVFDLRELVERSGQLWRRAIPESIAVELELSDHPLHVRADATQLEQVLLNLCLNARDAIANTGTILVRLARAAAVPDQSGRFVTLEVRDTGAGMDQATVARAFEPFFTTKSKTKGTGLGLSMVHSLVTQNHGRIEIASVLGQGTSFTIYLPEVDERGEALAGRPPGGPTHEGHGRTILVAEDDPTVRELVVRILERASYRVIGAENGQRAVELFDAHADEIDLVLLDAVMPALGGRDAYEAIARRKPGVKVLFCSGYATEVLPDAFLEDHELTVLTKPYRPDTLLETVGRMLRSPPS